MLVKIDNDTALDMLMDRVSQWTEDEDVQELYRQMYENYIDGDVFDGGEFNVNAIVDNDYVNWCDVLGDGDTEYEEIKRIYDEQGLGDCSCESESGISYIEAEYHGMFLIRW